MRAPRRCATTKDPGRANQLRRNRSHVARRSAHPDVEPSGDIRDSFQLTTPNTDVMTGLVALLVCWKA
jgi:hypothetical protein